MNKPVFTLPSDVLPADSGLIAWVAEQGIDPKSVLVEGFHIDESDDGTLTLHWVPFDLDSNGKRHPSPFGDGGYAKLPSRSIVVTSIPTLQTEAVL